MPNFAKATAGSIKIRKGTIKRKIRKIAIEIGRKYIVCPYTEF